MRSKILECITFRQAAEDERREHEQAISKLNERLSYNHPYIAYQAEKSSKESPWSINSNKKVRDIATSTTNKSQSTKKFKKRSLN